MIHIFILLVGLQALLKKACLVRIRDLEISRYQAG